MPSTIAWLTSGIAWAGTWTLPAEQPTKRPPVQHEVPLEVFVGDLTVAALPNDAARVRIGDCAAAVASGRATIPTATCPALRDPKSLLVEILDGEARILAHHALVPKPTIATLTMSVPESTFAARPAGAALVVDAVTGVARWEVGAAPTPGAWWRLADRGWTPIGQRGGTELVFAGEELVTLRGRLQAEASVPIRLGDREILLASSKTVVGAGTPAPPCSEKFPLDVAARWLTVADLPGGREALRRTLPSALCVDVERDGSIRWTLHQPALASRAEREAAATALAGKGVVYRRTLPWLEGNRLLEVGISSRLPPEWTVTVSSASPIATGSEGDVLDFAKANAESTAAAPAIPAATLAPRLAGSFVVTLTETLPGKEPSGDRTRSQSVELVVLRSWSGALRFGVGLGWAPAERTWGTREDDGRIVLAAARDAVVDPEFVVGFVPFLRPGGRTYLPNRFELRAAPYVGVGVIGPNADPGGLPVTFLRSAGVGAELELGRYLGVAIAGTARLARMPLPWVDPGRTEVPADAASSLRTVPLPGVSVVLNLGPVYFAALAKQTGSSRLGDPTAE